jgi:hypothetical protein
MPIFSNIVSERLTKSTTDGQFEPEFVLAQIDQCYMETYGIDFLTPSFVTYINVVKKLFDKAKNSIKGMIDGLPSIISLMEFLALSNNFTITLINWSI